MAPSAPERRRQSPIIALRHGGRGRGNRVRSGGHPVSLSLAQTERQDQARRTGLPITVTRPAPRATAAILAQRPSTGSWYCRLPDASPTPRPNRPAARPLAATAPALVPRALLRAAERGRSVVIGAEEQVLLGRPSHDLLGSDFEHRSSRRIASHHQNGPGIAPALPEQFLGFLEAPAFFENPAQRAQHRRAQGIEGGLVLSRYADRISWSAPVRHRSFPKRRRRSPGSRPRRRHVFPGGGRSPPGQNDHVPAAVPAWRIQVAPEQHLSGFAS